MARQEIEAVFERVKTWPENRQAWAAEMLLGLETAQERPCDLSGEDLRALDLATAEADRGEFATDHEVGAVFGAARARCLSGSRDVRLVMCSGSSRTSLAMMSGRRVA